jgi:hypothetical protein
MLTLLSFLGHGEDGGLDIFISMASSFSPPFQEPSLLELMPIVMPAM